MALRAARTHRHINRGGVVTRPLLQDLRAWKLRGLFVGTLVRLAGRRGPVRPGHVGRWAVLFQVRLRYDVATRAGQRWSVAVVVLGNPGVFVIIHTGILSYGTGEVTHRHHSTPKRIGHLMVVCHGNGTGLDGDPEGCRVCAWRALGHDGANVRRGICRIEADLDLKLRRHLLGLLVVRRRHVEGGALVRPRWWWGCHVILTHRIRPRLPNCATFR